MTDCAELFKDRLQSLKSTATQAEPHDLLPLLEKKHFKPTIPIDRQVASHLRHLIQKKKLAPHTQLPSIRAMAELWDTNYHTVHDALSRLVGEGLIVLRPVRGSFVAAPRRALRRACLYHNHQLKSHVSAGDFYTQLNINIYSLLSKRGVAIVPYYDHRPFEKLHTLPSEIRKMASEGDIDAVIATEIYPAHTSWLSSLEVPVASLMLEQPNRKIEVNITKLTSLVVEQAVKARRKTIGLIHLPLSAHIKDRKEDLLRLEVERLAAEKGISVICPEKSNLPGDLHWEQRGALLCERLLDAAVPPDMIFVYPDSYLRGVATALVKRHVQVPEQILVVSHRNAESDIFIPFPMAWLSVKIEDFAMALLDQIDGQIQGQELVPVTIDVDIERSAPKPINPFLIR